MAGKTLLSGNEAVALGALEAGVSVATAYPGTPSTEILETLAKQEDIHAEWSVNEKVALETAVGAAYMGVRTICSMKHVGVNVAADPLMTLAYTGVKGGLVLVAADDPGMHSSQNEQDSRNYAKFAKILCLEPTDSQEAKDMTKTAFDLSEEFGLPIMLRTLTRIAHTSSPVEAGKMREKNKPKLEICMREWVMVPGNARLRHKVLNEKQPKLREYAEQTEYNKILVEGKGKLGILAFGSAANQALEAAPNTPLMRISTYPFPKEKIKKFISDFEEILVLEEGDPMLEETVRCMQPKVKGKISGEVPLEGELTAETVAAALGRKTTEREKPSFPLPMRPPILCPGCPHTSLYNALKKAEPAIVAGDIGCYTLGVNLGMLHTCLCMGASVNQAAGMSYAGIKRVAAVIGEGTFMHSGITGLINAVYNKADLVLIIMDNSTIAMTGHQPTPLSGKTASGKEGGKVSLEEIVSACGVASLDVADPYKEAETENLLKKRLDEPGVHVVISRGPCIIVKKRSAKK